MKLIRASRAGFCFGVERAVRMAHELADSRGPAFMYGPLIHNAQEVLRLAEAGIEPRDSIQDCVGRPTLVRTHGISASDLAEAQRLGVELVDTTCPYVVAPRRKMVAFGKQGRAVIILGESTHPEVQAMLSYASAEVWVASTTGDFPELPAATPLGVVAQTTFARAEFARLVGVIREHHPDTLVADTICDDTRDRRAEAGILAARVDLVLAVGGRHSSNTRRLFELVRSIQARSHLVETVSDLDSIDLNGVGTVGMVSGASTPGWILDRIEAWMADR